MTGRQTSHSTAAVAIFGIAPLNTLSGLFFASLFLTIYNLGVAISQSEWSVGAFGHPVYVLAFAGWLVGKSLHGTNADGANQGEASGDSSRHPEATVKDMQSFVDGCFWGVAFGVIGSFALASMYLMVAIGAVSVSFLFFLFWFCFGSMPAPIARWNFEAFIIAVAITIAGAIISMIVRDPVSATQEAHLETYLSNSEFWRGWPYVAGICGGLGALAGMALSLRWRRVAKAAELQGMRVFVQQSQTLRRRELPIIAFVACLMIIGSTFAAYLQRPTLCTAVGTRIVCGLIAVAGVACLVASIRRHLRVVAAASYSVSISCSILAVVLTVAAWHRHGKAENAARLYASAVNQQSHGDAIIAWTSFIRADADDSLVHWNLARAESVKAFDPERQSPLVAVAYSMRGQATIYRQRNSEKDGSPTDEEYRLGLDDLEKANDLGFRGLAIDAARGYAHFKLSENEKAISAFTSFLKAAEQLSESERDERLDVDWITESHRFRAYAYWNLQQYARSKKDWDMIVTPDHAEVEDLIDLAWLLATCPDSLVRDGQSALGYAQRAFEKLALPDASLLLVATGRQLFLQEFATAIEAKGTRQRRLLIDAMETLAAARAEMGEFRLAIELQKIVLDAIDSDASREARQKLELYSSGMPFREA